MLPLLLRGTIVAAAVFTGSGAPSLPAITASGSGTFTAPPETFTGSGAVSTPALTASGSGTFTAPTYTGTSGRSLRFYGSNTADVDRVRIPLTTSGGTVATAANVGGGDFTYEVWIRCAYADNPSSNTGDWRYSNVLFDRDIWSDSRGHGLGVTRDGSDLVAVFGVAGAGLTHASIAGTTNVGDGSWHHIVIDRNASTGLVRLGVDGVWEDSGTYTTGSLAYPTSYTPTGGQDNEYIVLGQEKHDVEPDDGFTGRIAFLRISDARRYTGSSYTVPVGYPSDDGDTAALYLFNEGTGTTLGDSSSGNTDGTLLVGGSSNGPTWDTSAPFGVFVPALTVSGSGTFATVTYTGSGTPSTPALTASGSGTFTAPTYIGTGAPSLPALTASGAGTHVAPTYTGSGTPTLPALTASGTGVYTNIAFTGSGAPTLPALTASGSGTFATVGFNGTGAVDLSALTASGTGTFTAPVYTGSGTPSLPALTASGSGTHTAPTYTGSGAVSLPALTASGSGLFAAEVYSGTGAVDLPALTASGSGTFTAGAVTGSGAPSLPALTASGSGTFTAPVYTGSGTPSLPALTASGVGDYSNIAFTGSGAGTLPALTASGTGTFSEAPPVVDYIDWTPRTRRDSWTPRTRRDTWTPRTRP